jgi:hypothetical protein
MESSPASIDLSPIAAKYAVSPAVVEDLYARRRAGARDAELINLLGQQDRGGLEPSVLKPSSQSCPRVEVAGWTVLLPGRSRDSRSTGPNEIDERLVVFDCQAEAGAGARRLC